MTTLSDEAIIQKLQSPNPEDRNQALSYIYKANYPMVAHFIKKNSGTELDAEDIFQDSLIALYNKIIDGKLILSASMQTYIYSIAKNLWLKKLRNKYRNLELKEVHESVPLENHFFDELIRDERNEIIADILEGMGSKCKKILRLFYFERMSMKEIMVSMGWQSVQVAKNKKSACMKKLKATILDNSDYRALLK